MEALGNIYFNIWVGVSHQYMYVVYMSHPHIPRPHMPPPHHPPPRLYIVDGYASQDTRQAKGTYLSYERNDAWKKQLLVAAGVAAPPPAPHPPCHHTQYPTHASPPPSPLPPQVIVVDDYYDDVNTKPLGHMRPPALRRQACTVLRFALFHTASEGGGLGGPRSARGCRCRCQRHAAWGRRARGQGAGGGLSVKAQIGCPEPCVGDTPQRASAITPNSAPRVVYVVSGIRGANVF